MCLLGLHGLLLLINNLIYYYFYFFLIYQLSAVLQELLFSHIPSDASGLCQHLHISPPSAET